MLPLPPALLPMLPHKPSARRHENVIAVRDLMRPASRDANDVYLVYELMDTDLHQIIRSSQPLSDDHFQYFIYQVQGGCWAGGLGCTHTQLVPAP